MLGEYDEGGDMPPALEDWLTGYANEMEWYANDSLVVDEPQDEGASEEQRKDIKYMCKANWAQGAPYNDLIVFDGEKCVTGCWATAVAIIMHYWGSKGFHRGCTPTTKYHYSDGWQNNEPLESITVFDYRNLKPNPKTDAEKKAVATLMKYIGFACKLKYTPTLTTVSGSIATPYLKSALRMGDTISYISSEKLGAEKYEKAIYNEIVNGRPCIIRGANSSNNNGHFFVADGYRASDLKYHINWGWGAYNGYFALTALTPKKGHDYHYYKYATIGIQPSYYLGDVNGDGTINITDAMVLLDRINNGDTSIVGDVNSDGTISVADMMLIVDTILGKKTL